MVEINRTRRGKVTRQGVLFKSSLRVKLLKVSRGGESKATPVLHFANSRDYSVESIRNGCCLATLDHLLQEIMRFPSNRS